MSTQGRSDPSALRRARSGPGAVVASHGALLAGVAGGLVGASGVGGAGRDFGDGMNAAFRSSMTFAAVLVLLYLGLNCGLSPLNRWALGLYGLKFPIIMTANSRDPGSFALLRCSC